MFKVARLPAAMTLVVALSITVAACGGSSGGGSGSGNSTASGNQGKQGGSITIAAGTAPESADNQFDFTTQGTELYSVVNTPLLAFKRAAGEAGTQIIPGLAQGLPTVSKDKLTYTFQLRPNIHYSNGTAIKASDFTYGVERAIKIGWTEKSFLTGFIKGAEAYDSGKAKSISGITADDKMGKITVTLSQPFGAIVDVLALAGTAPVPQSTPMTPQNSTGTIGDGPYKWGAITPGRTYTLVKNAKYDIPGQPRGHVDKITYQVNSNVLANAQSVLQNQADVFDPGDTLPSSILSQVQQQKDRYQAVPTNSTFYFFMAVNQKPFNSLKARQAVLAGLDLRALSRLDSGFLTEDCHLIPPGIPGHSNPANCPYHKPTDPPNMNLAKQLVQQSGEKGAKVTVWGEERSPRKQYVDYLTDMLNKIGFNASEKILTSQVYFQTIGNAKTKPQIGFADWVQDFPNPWDFMQLNTTAAIQPVNSTNYGYVSDKHYDSTVAKLAETPANELRASVTNQWAALDDYGVKNGYYAAYGHEKFPKFYSNRLNFSAGVLSVQYQTDMTSLQLK